MRRECAPALMMSPSNATSQRERPKPRAAGIRCSSSNLERTVISEGCVISTPAPRGRRNARCLVAEPCRYSVSQLSDLPRNTLHVEHCSDHRHAVGTIEGPGCPLQLAAAVRRLLPDCDIIQKYGFYYSVRFYLPMPNTPVFARLCVEGWMLSRLEPHCGV